MVTQTLVNIDAEARARISAIIEALTILIIILTDGLIIEQIPMVALVGIMMMVPIMGFIPYHKNIFVIKSFRNED